MYKSLFLSIVFFGLFACGSISKSKYFQVQKSTKSVIYGGVSGTPITYHLVSNVVIKKTGTVTCDSFWANGYTGIGRILDKENNLINARQVQKGEEITFDFYYFVMPPPENPENPPNNGGNGSLMAPPPVEHVGELLFSYTFNKKKKFISISNLQKGEPTYGQ